MTPHHRPASPSRHGRHQQHLVPDQLTATDAAVLCCSLLSPRCCPVALWFFLWLQWLSNCLLGDSSIVSSQPLAKRGFSLPATCSQLWVSVTRSLRQPVQPRHQQIFLLPCCHRCFIYPAVGLFVLLQGTFLSGGACLQQAGTLLPARLRRPLTACHTQPADRTSQRVGLLLSCDAS